MQTSIDIQAIIAVTWVISSFILTLLLFNTLGARGWVWLGIHHILCTIGCSHEYLRYQKRQVLRRKALSQ